jgi:hypothetical protein
MFAYNPQVNDRSGEIYGAHQVNAAETRRVGQEKLGEGIRSGLSSVGQGISGGMMKSQENRIASEGVNAKFDVYKGMKNPDGSPVMQQSTIDKFDTMSLPQRQATISTTESLMDHNLKTWMYQQQYTNRVSQAQLQNQVPANQQPYTPPAQQANPAGGINMNFVK